MIEWYEVAGALLTDDCLFLDIKITGENERCIHLHSSGTWIKRLEKAIEKKQLT